MSIAVSALVGPSRARRLVPACAALALAAAAVALGLADATRYRAMPLAALVLAAAAADLLAVVARPPKMHRIDISGTGELRVTVQQGLHGPEGAEAATVLLPGSVVWPPLMLLRCRATGVDRPGRARAAPLVVQVWRDGVDPATWRALAVALAAIGRRAGADEGIGTLR